MKKIQWTLAAVALAALAGNLAPAAHAQDGDGWTVTKALQSEKLDYSKLNNSTYDYADIATAKGNHYSDNQVATMLKIAKLSGQRFKDVFWALNRGETFAMLAGKYNIPYSRLRHVDAEKDEIAAFESAYLATGKTSARRDKIDAILMK
ncbi:hypothetical protein CCAX7_17330 [Capsulimonas corticalis]|uniref:Uncharacterized protein n=1 Tax=Capsulimonas corticalis TaxID=2219043 RepID=A0A402D433_9BACT|nr:hypothetical protein [Capsulimonas corticalis]BDI29682.1 hypothetical protein CCAX7_17330 [Capsulimonas corticalis]